MREKIILTIFLSFLCFVYSNAQENTQDNYFPKGSISLRTNVAHWVVLTPNLGLEYKASDNAALLIEGGWARWELDTRNKYWRVWNVSPQVRYYTGELKDNYIGLQYNMGEYNLVGNQSKYMGGGFTLGHQFYLAKNLMVDLGLSLGYLYLHDKEEYEHIDGHDYRTTSKSSHGYWGPTGLSLSFVWKIN